MGHSIVDCCVKKVCMHACMHTCAPCLDHLLLFDWMRVCALSAECYIYHAQKKACRVSGTHACSWALSVSPPRRPRLHVATFLWFDLHVRPSTFYVKTRVLCMNTCIPRNFLCNHVRMWQIVHKNMHATRKIMGLCSKFFVPICAWYMILCVRVHFSGSLCALNQNKTIQGSKIFGAFSQFYVNCDKAVCTMRGRPDRQTRSTCTLFRRSSTFQEDE
jgi:hypothetical protein